MKSLTLIPSNTIFRFCVRPEMAASRVDVFLSRQFPRYSRSFFQTLIDEHLILINDQHVTKSSHRLNTHDILEVAFPQPPQHKEIIHEKVQELTVPIVHSNEHFMVLDKPHGLTVHQSHITSSEPTVVDWLIHHFASIKDVGESNRPGIVHRLDKNTSGLLLIARNNVSHALISALFKNRAIQKTYLAVVRGHPDKEGTLDAPIGRHPSERHKMTHLSPQGKPATTHYRVLEYFKDTALLELKPVTGRTHQIRVHLASIGHPIVGDHVYGSISKHIHRHALHAHKLSFIFEQEPYNFTAELPDDMQKLVAHAKSKKLF